MAVATTPRSVQGYTLSYDIETSLGVAGGSPLELRLEEAPTIDTKTRESAQQVNLGHANAYDFGDKPIPYELALENAITIPVQVRRGDDDQAAPLMTMLESGGWTITASAPSGSPTISTYTSDTQFTSSADLFGGSDAFNVAVLVELNDGTYYPTLLRMYDDAPSRTLYPVMGLPSASQSGKELALMYSATANASDVSNTKTLSIDVSTRGLHTTAPDLNWKFSGCSMSDLGELSITKDDQLVVSPSFHVASRDIRTHVLAASSFAEHDPSVPIVHQTSPLFRFEFAPFASMGGISHTSIELIRATIRPAITTVMVGAIGSNEALNGIQGFIQRAAQPEIELTVLMDKDYWEDVSKGFEDVDANQDTYIGFTWGSDSKSHTAAGIWAPRCYLLESPTSDPFGDNYQLATLKYVATAPEWSGSPTYNGAPGMSPIVIAISGDNTPA